MWETHPWSEDSQWEQSQPKIYWCPLSQRRAKSPHHKLQVFHTGSRWSQTGSPTHLSHAPPQSHNCRWTVKGMMSWLQYGNNTLGHAMETAALPAFLLMNIHHYYSCPQGYRRPSSNWQINPQLTSTEKSAQPMAESQVSTLDLIAKRENEAPHLFGRRRERTTWAARNLCFTSK